MIKSKNDYKEWLKYEKEKYGISNIYIYITKY